MRWRALAINPATTRFHFVTPVWGRSYVELFLNLVLPTHLSPNNLGRIPADRCLYKLYTTPQDEEVIRASPSFKALQGLAETTFVDIGNLVEQYRNVRASSDPR